MNETSAFSSCVTRWPEQVAECVEAREPECRLLHSRDQAKVQPSGCAFEHERRRLMPTSRCRKATERLCSSRRRWRERHSLASELDRVRVTTLMRREPAPNTSSERGPAQLPAYGGRRPRPPTRWTINHTEQRADGQLETTAEPRAR